MDRLELSEVEIQALASTLAVNLTTRFPFHDSHFWRDGDERHRPHTAHPIFGNSYDWHSSANSSWAVAALSHRLGRASTASRAWECFASSLTRENIQAELSYFQTVQTYERPYGWAWLLALYAELPERERTIMYPLAEYLATRSDEFLAAMLDPVRHGVHSNTAFAMTLMMDAGRRLVEVDDLLDVDGLIARIEESARLWFSNDENWPEAMERSGHDFLSPGLAEAELMARLDDFDFTHWFERFLPGLSPESKILIPVDSQGSTDPQQVHWHGLNLSRAAALVRVARRLPGSWAWLNTCARELYDAALPHATGSEYASTHWLPSYVLRAHLA